MSETYIDIMIQSLKKKEEVLDQIILLNRKQKNALEDPKLTPEYFDELVEEKGKCIDQLEKLDSGFEKLFARTKEELEGRKEKYSPQIKDMQKRIRSITDKSMEVQAQESRNKDLMMKKFTDVRRQARTMRTGTEVANKYYQTMSKLNFVDPQFMDTKSK